MGIRNEYRKRTEWTRRTLAAVEINEEQKPLGGTDTDISRGRPIGLWYSSERARHTWTSKKVYNKKAHCSPTPIITWYPNSTDWPVY